MSRKPEDFTGNCVFCERAITNALFCDDICEQKYKLLLEFDKVFRGNR